jgi:hypothetical protein
MSKELPANARRPNKPTLPVVQSFITCHEVFRGQRSGTAILLGPSAHIPMANFPGHTRLAVFAEFTGGHGSYVPRLSLRDPAGDEVWDWPAVAPFQHSDPLLPSEVVLNELTVAVPAPGRYTLVLLLNGEESARRTLWFGPAEAFRPPAG